jgi:hypothetical protein
MIKARVLLALLAIPLAAQSTIQEALDRAILAPEQTRVDTQVWTASRVPVLPLPKSRVEWNDYASALRRRILDEVVYRGAAREWRQQTVEVVRLGELRGHGYIVRKLRFEAVPGLHVPALLYEPDPPPAQPAAVVLNVNGHEGNGVATPYIQARCINLARKGLYALNVEWIGRGQLRTEGLDHYRMNQLDLVGTSGLAVFYESLRRSVDIALALPQADRSRLAVTGLSGGGWQTIFLSALDTRVTLANPVAGHSSFVTRAQWPALDLGDSEQTPSGLAAVADYAHLNALVAPRPLLLTYNAKDNCCFRADYAAGAMVQMVAPVYQLLHVAHRLAYHVNHDPGHNYERDNREAFYRFLHVHFFGSGSAFSPEEIDVSAEIRSAEELAVPIPTPNADFRDLARRAGVGLPRPGKPLAGRLGHLVRFRRYQPAAIQAAQPASLQRGVQASFWKLRMDHWMVPAVELAPPGAQSTSLLLADEGRRALAESAQTLLASGRRVVALDPFYFGESGLGQRDFLFALLLDSLNERPLGIQAGQVAAAARWLAARHGAPVEIEALGPRMSLIAMVAAALEPQAISGVKLHQAWRTLREVFDKNISARQMPELFCFGLLEEFDVPQIEALIEPRPVAFL